MRQQHRAEAEERNRSISAPVSAVEDQKRRDRHYGSENQSDAIIEDPSYKQRRDNQAENASENCRQTNAELGNPTGFEQGQQIKIQGRAGIVMGIEPRQNFQESFVSHLVDAVPFVVQENLGGEIVESKARPDRHDQAEKQKKTPASSLVAVHCHARTIERSAGFGQFLIIDCSIVRSTYENFASRRRNWELGSNGNWGQSRVALI